ncbi:IclR family transcriptional regulator [Micromonospora sp. WMMD1102]|uniref:IclR family transcriptional regulator n=1 Tax=Micromonospora sp. WMMD1102 TaxID=3016105 RepID=UPI0024156E20|nr:IclR family transcriptional regulator [Micromonospora sp. WMMD1102]MDG4791729.1 IclR family transcriptional regulator [Micromonospora sp. WMMD1102]
MTAANPSRSEADMVKSAHRGLEILDLLTQREIPLTFTEIADALAYPRSSLHGLLRTLVQSGWAELDPVTRRYSLGIRAWQAGNAYLRAVDLADRARPYMERVRDALDETVQLAVLDGRHNVYLCKVDGTQMLVLASAIGRRLASHATGVGKVLLAGLSPAERLMLLKAQPLERFTTRTITDLDALEAELAEVRRRGYAIDSEEYTIGVRCVAVPVRDHTGGVTAGMSVPVPTIRFDGDRAERARAVLTTAAADLSAALGFATHSSAPAAG